MSGRARQAMLAQLRAEREKIGAREFHRAEAPNLYDLAAAASSARGKSVRFRGVRFPCRFGLWRYVFCPQTRQTLVAVSNSGGWL